jgi:hypothetical protein
MDCKLGLDERCEVIFHDGSRPLAAGDGRLPAAVSGNDGRYVKPSQFQNVPFLPSSVLGENFYPQNTSMYSFG